MDTEIPSGRTPESPNDGTGRYASRTETNATEHARGTHDAQSATDRATDSVDDAARFAKERAGAMWYDAKESARSKLNEQKDAAADGIGGVAGALRDVSRKNEQTGERNAFAGFTESAADGLDRLSGTLRQKDVSTMLHDMESFARSQPVAFFGLALAAGFLGVRFLKASNP